MIKQLLSCAAAMAVLATAAGAAPRTTFETSTTGPAGGSGAELAADMGQQETRDIMIHAPWARATAGKLRNGAAYLTIVNQGKADDRLVAATSSISSRVELHNTQIDDKGVMRMREVRGIDIPAGQTVKIAPGGYHVMLVDLRDPLVKGESFSLKLRFEKAGEREVTVPVRGIRTMKGGHGGGHGGD